MEEDGSCCSCCSRTKNQDAYGLHPEHNFTITVGRTSQKIRNVKVKDDETGCSSGYILRPKTEAVQ